MKLPRVILVAALSMLAVAGIPSLPNVAHGQAPDQ